MTRNRIVKPGWWIHVYSYTRMATWEQQLIDQAQQAFDPARPAEENRDNIKAVASSFNKPILNVSFRVCGRRERSELNQYSITIWKGSRALVGFSETVKSSVSK